MINSQVDNARRRREPNPMKYNFVVMKYSWVKGRKKRGKRKTNVLMTIFLTVGRSEADAFIRKWEIN